jgi:hypothetical protein
MNSVESYTKRPKVPWTVNLWCRGANNFHYERGDARRIKEALNYCEKILPTLPHVPVSLLVCNDS